MKFNLLDGIILAWIALGVWRGVVAGLIRELSQLIGVFVGFALALQLMKPAGVFLVTIVSVIDLEIGGATLLAFVGIFVITYVIVVLVSKMLERVADGVALGPVNKFFGGIIGGAKSALVLSIILVFIGQIGFPGKKAESTSYLHGPIEKIAPEAWDVFSRSVPTAAGMTRSVGERFWTQEAEEEERPAESESGSTAEN